LTPATITIAWNKKLDSHSASIIRFPHTASLKSWLLVRNGLGGCKVRNSTGLDGALLTVIRIKEPIFANKATPIHRISGDVTNKRRHGCDSAASMVISRKSLTLTWTPPHFLPYSGSHYLKSVNRQIIPNFLEKYPSTVTVTRNPLLSPPKS
jgi:hypothetical protein